MPRPFARHADPGTLVLVAGLVFIVPSASQADEDYNAWVAQQQAALKIIGDFASSECTEVSASGSLTHNEAAAKASATLSNILRVIGTAGLDATLRHSSDNWQGVAQAQLANAYQHKDECHFRFVTLLVPTLLQPFVAPNTQPSSQPPARPSQGPESSAPSASASSTTGSSHPQTPQASTATDRPILRVFMKSNVTAQHVDLLRAALPDFDVQIGHSNVDKRLPDDLLFVNSQRVREDRVLQVAKALSSMGIYIKSVQIESLGGRNEIQLGTIDSDVPGKGQFASSPALDLNALSRLNGSAFWNTALNGQKWCPVGNGNAERCE